ncbi:hypothetical protein NDU88_008798 [Pleurodeles waltl]|uniref:Uncharacterized protein n=1 Tax=Pleurodeles waltl TaxID=8319 RepID=A0AAV7RYM8_PLEWA|nr:hypothetical protein NDU88_008798 [Pleurodeles waltl]
MRSPGGHTQSGLLTGQLRGAPRPCISPLCVVPQSGGIRLRLPSRRPIRRRQVPPADAPARTPPSGWARIQGQRRALRTAQSGAAAATRRRTTWVQARTGAHESVGGRPLGRSRTQAAPVASAAHLQCTNMGSPRHSAPRPRPPAGPRPPRSPEQPQSLGGPLQGGKTAPPWSPRPQQSSHSALDTGPPASARPGTDLKSAPPEPIR